MVAMRLSGRVIPARLHAVLVHPGVGVLLAYFVGIALRVKYTIDIHRPEDFLGSDMSMYVQHARRLIQSGGAAGPWDVMHPLGFPAFLAFLLAGGSLTRAAYAQLVVSCLVPGAVGLLGAAAFGRRTGLLAVVFASLYFPFIEYGALFLSEIHFVLWLALAFAAFLGAIDAQRRAVSLWLAGAGGLALSVAIAMKNVGLLAAVAFFAAEGVGLLLARRADRPEPPPARWTPLRPWLVRGALVAIGAAPLMGVMTRVCTAANSGQFCFSGNKPAADFLLGHYGRIEGLDWMPIDGIGVGFVSPGVVLRHYEGHPKLPWMIEDNAANAAEAWRWIAAHPLDAAVLSLDHIYDTFFGVAMWPSFGQSSWPFAHLSQYVFVVLLFVPTLFAFARVARGGLRRLFASRAALVLSPAGALAITVAIATGEVRYRVPFDIFFIVVACALAVGELQARDPQARESTNTPTTGK
jgi:hypothetical protein